MPLIKEESNTGPVTTGAIASPGPQITPLSNNSSKSSGYKPKTPEEIRGQVKMHAAVAAVTSPSCPAFSTPQEYKAWFIETANWIVAYTFGETGD